MKNIKMEELKKINARFMSEHYLEESDLKKAEELKNKIEETRNNKEPKTGDIVRYTNEHGDFYGWAHIETIENGIASICEQPYTPFINEDLRTNTSGGTWKSLEINKMKYKGKEEKMFCFWGNCGACGNGAVNFKAYVNVWEYKAKNIYGKYSTEKYNKMYIHFNDNKEMTGTNYTIFGNGIAWETIEEYELFKKTYKAKEFKTEGRSKVIFFYKEFNHYITKEEYDKMELPEDTRQYNGIVKVKVKYNDKEKTIDTYRYSNSGEFWGIEPLYKLARERKEI